MAGARRRTAARLTAVAGGVGWVASAGSVGLAAYALRRLTSPEERADDVVVYEVRGAAGAGGQVVLTATEETTAPGLFGLWLHGGAGHARLGAVRAVDRGTGRVTRELLGVDAGRLRPGPARWNIYHHGAPPDVSLGLAYDQVRFPGELGDYPAWLVPGDPRGALADQRRWAILVHGRGAQLHECLRGVGVAARLGITSLVCSYRNDRGAPASPDGRYGLGLSEWRDVDAAMAYALAHGASSLDLVGWSMGGAMVLQATTRSPRAGRIRHVVLDSPVIDWADVLAHHVKLGRIPVAIARLAPHVLRSRAAGRLVGVAGPMDLAQADWVARGDELASPILLIHSIDDEFVPVGPSAELAAARPDLVRYERWEGARHTQEWNLDPDRWERLVAEFLSG